MAEKTCPTCQGRGFMPAGFYNPSSEEPETCRSCGGRTVVEAAAGPPPSSDPLDLQD